MPQKWGAFMLVPPSDPNEAPNVSELSKDRWKIFRIRDDDLIDVTDIYLGKM